MDGARLGATVGVSESTVVRFATEIGYTGYPELQQAMQEMIRNKLTSVQRMEVTANRIGENDILDSVFNQDNRHHSADHGRTPMKTFIKGRCNRLGFERSIFLGGAQFLGVGDFFVLLHASAV